MKLTFTIFYVFLLLSPSLTQYEDEEEDYYGEDEYYEDDTSLYQMSFFLVPDKELKNCELEKVLEKVGADPDSEFSLDLIESLKGDPVLGTCGERYNEFYKVSFKQ